MRKRHIFILSLAALAALGALSWRRSSNRSPRRSVDTEPLTAPDGLPETKAGGSEPADAPGREYVADTRGSTEAPVRSWRPSAFDVPTWGRFWVEIRGAQEGADADLMCSIRVLTWSPTPHFVIRLLPAAGTAYVAGQIDSLLQECKISVESGEGSLVVVRASEPWSEAVVGPSGDQGVVQVVPFEIQGLSSWRGRTGITNGNVLMKAARVEGLVRPHIVARGVQLLSALATPTIGPSYGDSPEKGRRLEESELAEATVVLHGVDGLEHAAISAESEDQQIGASVVTMTLAVDGMPVVVPTALELNGATLRIVARLVPGWWSRRHSLVLVYDVWDRHGRLHTLRWKPD